MMNGGRKKKMALLHVDFFSEVLEKCTSMDVILPQNTKNQIGLKGNARNGKYKTAYLLHGMRYGSGGLPLSVMSVSMGSLS